LAAKKLTGEEWEEYLALYGKLSEQLSREHWFADGWQTHFDYLNRENPRGVWLELVRTSWFDGAIHLETWVNNAVLERKHTPLVVRTAPAC
jgi:hypothetical protein